ncbi:Pentatricopeptide repeat-containing protein [Apostasia shenzhenica]|uniref:Pentatricopeptide repeat-containing protein n=1 Tax=Apostasia shenzhenica TaxID=1088818 RepID=A0A2I0ARW7_9ASPA|nr:Pentatricopeptide repeat-containing protein [Apostasia shenzhenica]
MLISHNSCCTLIFPQHTGARIPSDPVVLGHVFLGGGNRKKSKKKLLFVDLNDGFSSKLDLGAVNVVGNVYANCSTKCLAYGGCIPLILRALEDIKDLDEALKPWEGNLSNKERTIILKEQTNWRRALDIFSWFKSKGCYELNVIHYNIMLRVLGMAKKWDLIWSLLSEMQHERIIPTNATYGTLINAYSKGGLKKEALMWLGEMYKQGVEPDEVTMGTVVQTYKKAGEFTKAQDFFKRWSLSMGYALRAQKSYSLYTYNTLIDTYGKAGLLGDASNTFAHMLSEGIVPDRVTFNTMIHVCGNHGCFEEVVSLVEMMEEVQCSPDTRTYNILISLYAKSDNICLAVNYFSKMKVAGLIPDIVSYRTLLYAFSLRRMVKEAESLVMEMESEDLKIDEYTQTALTRMYVKLGMIEESWAWFEKFCDKMSSECYSANIDAFGEHGILILAEKAFIYCVERQRLSVLVFNVMIKAYGISKEYDKACEVFKIMENHHIFPDKCTYGSLIQILSGVELPHRAVTYLSGMQRAGLECDCILYSMVISSFIKLGEVRTAENLFKEMINVGLQPDIVAFSVLINAFAELGDVHKAVSYVELMKSSGLAPNSIICNSLIKLYTKVGYLREAEEIYSSAKASETGAHPYSSNCMIHLFCENSMVCEAEEVFSYLKLRGEANEFSYAMMLCLYKKMGRFPEAHKVAQEMRDLGLTSDKLSYNNLIGLYASEGRIREAFETLQQMLALSIQPNDATFRSLGVVMLKKGASKEAIKLLEKIREENSQCGLNEWFNAMCSMLRLDENYTGFCAKEKVKSKVDSSLVNVHAERCGSSKRYSYG